MKNIAALAYSRERWELQLASNRTSIFTCRRHNIDPQRYLIQLLTNWSATPISQLGQWLLDRRSTAIARRGGAP